MSRWYTVHLSPIIVTTEAGADVILRDRHIRAQGTTIKYVTSMSDSFLHIVSGDKIVFVAPAQSVLSVLADHSSMIALVDDPA